MLRGKRPANLAHLVLVTSGLAMLGILAYVGQWLLFWRDEWDWIFTRSDPTARALLHPYLDTFVAVPVLIYEGLLALFGLRTYLPFLATAWITHLVIVALLYRILTRRTGEVLGLVAAISVLFLGSGFEVLLHPFQVQYLFAAAGGLLAIDQLDKGRRPIAAGALIFGVASSGLGVIFTGLVILLGVIRRDRGAVAASIPAVVVYGAWYFTWGRESGHLAPSTLGLVDNLYAVLFGIGAAMSGLVGLPPARFALVGLAIIVALAVMVGVAVWRGYRPDPLAPAALAALVVEHSLQTYFRGTFGVEHGARSGYVYAAVIFLWLVLGGLVGRRLDRLQRAQAVRVAAVLLLVPMVAGNMRQFAGAAVESRGLRATELAELRLIESLRGDPRLAFDVQPDDVHLIALRAGDYLEAVDRFGRPSMSWDWPSEVDQAAVDAARTRLLTGP